MRNRYKTVCYICKKVCFEGKGISSFDKNGDFQFAHDKCIKRSKKAEDVRSSPARILDMVLKETSDVRLKGEKEYQDLLALDKEYSDKLIEVRQRIAQYLKDKKY